MMKFSKNEMRDLIIAYIVITTAFAISNLRSNPKVVISILPIIMVGVGIGFLLHEIGHKYMAMQYGYKSEFKMWPLGLLIALATAFIGMVFAAPGEAKIDADGLSDEELGRIKLAGPMANLGLAIIFIIIAALIYPNRPYSMIFELMYLICTIGFSVNAFLATFNLLPLMTLDGTKVLKWDAKVWIIVFTFSAVMMLLSITIGAETMVGLILGI